MTKPLFEAPLTLFGLPYSQSFATARAAVIGVPFDCGIDPTRFGPRLGPNAIRQASILTATLLQDADVSPLDGVVDAGNITLALDNIESAFDSIEQAMRAVLSENCIPLTLGGDGAVSLPQMRAIKSVHDKIAVLHFDAHTDAWKLESNDHFDNTTQFTHAANEDLIDVPNAIHVGTRGPVNAQRAIDYARGLGYEVIPYSTVRLWGEERLLEHLHARLAGRKVYLCFDMDFFDPSIAPGVATPTPGGAVAAEGLALVRGLKGLDIVAADINTVTPLHDPAGVSASLAASVAAECLALIGD